MADYQKMYHTLFSEMSKAIEMMQNAQRMTEEMYISTSTAIVDIPKEQEQQPKRFSAK